MADSLSQLISTPLHPLREDWISPERVEQLRHCRELHDRDPDAYWEWVANQQRWMKPWDTLRSGELGDFHYYAGGEINVADNCVDRWAEDPASADRPAVIWEGEPGDTRTVTYAQLRDEVSSLAAGLLDLGVTKGDVVAIYMPNLVEAFTAIHACNRIGAIYTVLFSGFGSEAVANRLIASRTKAVIVADASYRRGKQVPLLDNLRTARERASTVAATVVVDRTGEGRALQDGEHSYASVVAAHPEGTPCIPLEPNENAFLIFTSGTESTPKGVVHSVGGFLVGTWANAHWQVGRDRDDDVYFCAADVGWLTFPIQAVIGGLACGMSIVCFEGAMDTPSTARFYEICERHAVTKVLCAPTLLRMLRKFGDELAAEHPLPKLRLVTVQGEPLDADTFGWSSEHLGGGIPVINAYGQTETGSTWTYPVFGVDDLKAGSVGTTLPGHAYEILDDDGNPVPAGTKGNLVLTRPFPTLCRTVWDDAARYHDTYFAKFPGNYSSNDEAVLDPDGHLWVLGRADDVINVAAHRISTMEIEAVVTSHPSVVEAAVVGVPDETKGTVPIAFITLAPDTEANGLTDEIRKQVVGELGGYAGLAAVYITSAMPKTRTGKIMRRVLRDVIVHGEPQSDISPMDDTSALDAVSSAISSSR